MRLPRSGGGAQGTGETNASGDSYYGTGVYKSIDSGRTWSLLIDSSPPTGQAANPMSGLGIENLYAG